MSICEVGRSYGPCRVEATDHRIVSQIWFKTEPLDRTFIYRAAQLQLQTDSSDQGPETAAMVPGSWSWFELIIFKDGKASQPREKDGKPLVWRSHGNRTDPFDEKDSVDRHFGVVFDRRQELLDALEVGNVIGVRVCAKYAGWLNNAKAGHLIAKVVEEDMFSPMSWTLNSKDAPADLPKSVHNGVYTLTPSTSCHVKASGLHQADRIWFTTPILTEDVIAKIQDLQLFTQANYVGNPVHDPNGTWCWFDIVILENADATQAKVQDGRSLVWRSHRISWSASTPKEQSGKLFGIDHEIFGHLEVGNVIGVRACAQFDGWELEGHSARMVVRIANQGTRKEAPKPDVDWKAIQQRRKLLQEQLAEYLVEVSGDSFAPVSAVEDSLLSREIRSDSKNGAGGKPLRVLSLDGGGVRGISSLYILKAIMEKVAVDKSAKPCDYFDMIGGTSTGGLIAIMLGRLKLSVDDCIKQFERLSSTIFHASLLDKGIKLIKSGHRYSSKILEQSIKDVVKKHTTNADAPLLDPKGSNCKVFVCAMRADNLSSLATLFRSYTNPNEKQPTAVTNCKIWEAARATSAAPTYFARMELGGVQYVDGGLGFNNPIFMMEVEADNYFGPARPLACIVTIGTGLPPKIGLPTSQGVSGVIGTAFTLLKLATDSESANVKAKLTVKPVDAYYRFNAPAQKEIDLADYERMNDLVEETKKYILGEVKRIGESARKLPPKHPLYLETSI